MFGSSSPALNPGPAFAGLAPTAGTQGTTVAVRPAQGDPAGGSNPSTTGSGTPPNINTHANTLVSMPGVAVGTLHTRLEGVPPCCLPRHITSPRCLPKVHRVPPAASTRHAASPCCLHEARRISLLPPRGTPHLPVVSTRHAASSCCLHEARRIPLLPPRGTPHLLVASTRHAAPSRCLHEACRISPLPPRCTPHLPIASTRHTHLPVASTRYTASRSTIPPHPHHISHLLTSC